MKTKLLSKAKELAATLLATLVLCSILGMFVVGYLSVIEHQHRLSVRSQSWNMTVAFVEAAVEEGLQQLNQNTTNLASNGWSYQGANIYSITRTFDGGNSYRVTLDVTSLVTPVIKAVATINLVPMAQNDQPNFFAAAFLAQVNEVTTKKVTRAVEVRCFRGTHFLGSIASEGTVDLAGKNIKSDSFSSCDPVKFPLGQYNAANAGSDGNIHSNGGLVNTVDVGNATVNGHVATGPGGTVGIGAQGGIGSQAWLAANGGQGIEPGYVADNSNFTFPDTTIPPDYAGYMTPSNGWVTIKSNLISYTPTNSSTYPVPTPMGGVTTNNIYITCTNCPPGPAKTNSLVQTPGWPIPAPCGPVLTNTTWSSQDPYPAPGTFVPGSVVTNASGKKFSYLRIDAYRFPTFTYTNFTYTWNLYSTNVVWSTNYYDNILGDGNYKLSEFSGKTLVLGNATLVVPNGFTMQNGDWIYISPERPNGISPEPSIKIYAGGTSVSISGNDVVNGGDLAKNFQVYCDMSVTSVGLSGNGQFIGVIVAPNATFTFNGGGSDTIDFVGALMAKEVKLNGHMQFHYDKCLENLPPDGRFLVTGWKEIAPADVPN